MKFVKLRIQIGIGYIILITLLVIVACIVCKEKRRINILEKEDEKWLINNELRSEIFLSLLNLSSTSELVLAWTEEDYQAYKNKRMVVAASLHDFKKNQGDAAQRICIDSIQNLLLKKEKYLTEILHLLETKPDVSEMLHNRIPIISQSLDSKIKEGTLNTKPKSGIKRKGILQLFAKKGHKSAYEIQREKEKNQRDIEERQVESVQPPSVLLYSLEKEIVDNTRLYNDKLRLLVDSLRKSSQFIDIKLEALIHDFEYKEIQSFKNKLLHIKMERYYSFYLICGIILGGFILIIVLYIIVHRRINRINLYQKKLELSNAENRALSLSRKNILLSVSHDLRAPLSSISEYAKLISEEKDKEQCDRYADNILRTSHHVIGLANNLLYYYRLEAGKEQISKDIFHPGRIIENIIYSFRPIAIKKGLELTVECIGIDTMVEGDKLRLTQILNNLLSNAIKFTQIGNIYVSAHYREEQLCFSVRDTGVGIDADKQKDIFRDFEKSDAKSGELGFGLGLTITAKLVALLDGTINVKSRLGEGSIFKVCLPMKEASKYEIERSACFNLSGLKIVLVDDDKILADLTRRMLLRNGIQCDYCQSVKELIELLRNNKYDLLLTDMQMPDIDGYKILELLRNSNLGQSKDIPIVAVTARIDENVTSYAEVGFAGYLHKPFSINELLATLASCMNNKAPQWREVDFSILFEGENDQKGMLDMFIHDTEITLDHLREAIAKRDYKKISALIHKGLPLWETMHIGTSIIELERLASLPPKKWGEALLIEVKELIKAIKWAVDAAKQLRRGLE